MKLKNRQILEFLKLGLVDKKLPVKLGYAIALNMETFQSIVNAYDKSRTILIDMYAEKDDDGNPIIEGDHYVFDDIVGWNRAIEELLNTEVDVNVSTINKSDLEKCDDPAFDNLSVRELAVIGFMIEN